MENGSSSTTGTKEVSVASQFASVVPQTYYQQGYNNGTNNIYGNMYERPSPQAQSIGESSFPPQGQLYRGTETPTCVASGANIIPTQPDGPHTNLSTFSSYVASLPAPPPYAPHPNPMFGTLDHSRAGSLPLTSEHSLDHYLSTPQPHLLQLRGTNSMIQQPQTNNFPLYGMPDRPQRFTIPFSSDPSLKQPTVGPIHEDESSSAFREASSHINRKKRKACGRCGPCQRKENCGTCMNCVNRAKGKQICIYRKCEELKKKPGSENYATSTTPDHQVESVAVRHDKRKELDQLFTERKRSRTEDSVGLVLPQGALIHQKYPGFTPTQQNFGQPPLPPQQQPFVESLSGIPNSLSSPFQQQVQQNHSPHSFSQTQNSGQLSIGSSEPAPATDIISEALREIENTPVTGHLTTDLADVLSQGATTASNKEVNNPNYNQQSNYQQWNIQSAESIQQQQQTPSLLQAQLQGDIRLPGQPPPLPPGPGPGQQPSQSGSNHYQTTPQAGSQDLPDQLLSNLARFNEFGSFQRSVSSPTQSGVLKRPVSASCTNYEGVLSHQQSQQKFHTTQTSSPIDDNQLLGVIATSVPTTTQPILYNQSAVTADSGNMYRNAATLAYSMPYANDGSVQTMDSKVINPLAPPQLHRPYSSPAQPNSVPMQNYRPMMPHMAGMRYAATQDMNSTPHYPGQHKHIPMHRFPTNISLQSAEQGYFIPGVEQKHPILNQATSSTTMSGYSGELPGYAQNEQNKFGQGYPNSQYPPKQWDNQMTGSVSSAASVSSSTASPAAVKQEMTSPRASHSALHSPVSSNNQEASGPTTISHMPELAPSPVSQQNDVVTNSIKIERKSDSTFVQQMYANNVPIGNTHSGEQLARVNQTSQNYGMYSDSFLVHPGSDSRLQYAYPQASVPASPAYSVSHPHGINNHFQSHSTKHSNLNNNGQMLPAARLVQSTQFAENKTATTSATSNPNVSTWQPVQHSDSSTTNIASVASQSDTNLTISPGESGYDSAEIVQEAHSKQQLIEASSQHFPSFEANKSTSDDGQLNASPATVDRDSIEPKNLYRAPVGAKAGSVNNQAAYLFTHKKDDLPSAGACASKHKQFNTLLTNPNPAADIDATPSSMSKRSLSCDDAMYFSRFPEKEDERKAVRLRRFSNQEHSSTEQVKHNSTHSMPISKREYDGRLLMNERMKREYHDYDEIRRNIKHNEMQRQNIPRPDMKFINLQKSYDVVSTQRRLVPFDTPPVTPCSADFSIRQTSIDNASESGIAVSKISDILPTPPHTSDTPPGKFMPSGFASPASETCDFKPQNVPTPQHQAQPNTQFGTGFSNHRGSKAQTESGIPRKTEFAKCNCIEGTDGRNDDAPYYTHLGAAGSVFGIRQLFEKRTGYNGNAIRIEKVIYTGKEGKTSTGCPMAKWIIRRSSEEEKILVVCRQRPGHRCANAVIVVIILLWDGVARPLADFAYSNFTELVPKNGEPTERRCATNDERTCACQGFDDASCGASFSFGCSWSMYYNGCKFARSSQPNKYKLTATKNPDAEKFIGKLCERLATVMSPLYQMAAPDSFQNQVEFEEDSSECRLGEQVRDHTRPFSGVTSCIDFSAHSHKDQHNIDNGSTVVVTFTKPELRPIGIRPDDEQLHVLPLCKLDFSNEEGNFQGVAEKISSGAIEILERWRHEVRTRKVPKLSKKQKSRAVKKKNGMNFDATESPPYKRRGRPPKQYRSVENLAPSKHTDSSSGSHMFQSPPRPQTLLHGPHVNQSAPPHIQPPFSNPCSPTRWPYRRQASQYGADHHPFSPARIGSPQFENKQPKTPTQSDSQASLNENLPSIGDFFGQGNEPQATSSVEHPPSTPLPSINDVVCHPFHQNFAAVQAGQPTPSTPFNNPNAPQGNSSYNPNVTSSFPSHNPNANLGFPFHNPNMIPGNPSHNLNAIPGNPTHNPNMIPGNPSHNPNAVPGNPSHNPNMIPGNPSHNPNAIPGNPSHNPNATTGNPFQNPNAPSSNHSHNPNVSSGNPFQNPNTTTGNPFHNPNMIPGNPSHNPNATMGNPFQNLNATPGNSSHNPNMTPGPQHYGDAAISLKAYAARLDSDQAMEVGTSAPNQPGPDRPRQESVPQNFSDLPYEISYSDSEENFRNSEIGGVAVAPGHGSVLIECAKKELHATTALKKPNRFYPTRISLVFYLHKSMNARNHGAAEYEAKEEERRKLKEEKKMEELLKERAAREHESAHHSAGIIPGMADQPIRCHNPHYSGQYPTMQRQSPIWNPNGHPSNMPVPNHPSNMPMPNTQMNVAAMRMRSPVPTSYNNNVNQCRQENMDQARLKLREHLTATPHDIKRQHPNQMQGSPIRPQLNDRLNSREMRFSNPMNSQFSRMPPQYQSIVHERMNSQNFEWTNGLTPQNRFPTQSAESMHLLKMQGMDAMRQQHPAVSQHMNYPQTSHFMNSSSVHNETQGPGNAQVQPGMHNELATSGYMRSPAYFDHQMQNARIMQQQAANMHGQYMMRPQMHRLPMMPNQTMDGQDGHPQSHMYQHRPNMQNHHQFSHAAPPPYQMDHMQQRHLANTSRGGYQTPLSPYGTSATMYNPTVTQ